MLAACVPGAFGGWLLLLRDFGTWRLEDVLEFAIGYAEHGYPLHERIRATIELNAELLASWPGSRDLYLPRPGAGRALPEPRARGDVPAHRRRESAAARARTRSRGRERPGTRASSRRRSTASRAAEGGLLTGADLAAWEATLEPVVTLEYRGLTVCKTQPWAAGPVGLQQLALLQGFDLAELSEAEFVHVVTECAKLAFADRDALYGDADVRLDILLSRRVQRRAARARRRGRVGRVQPGLRAPAEPARGGGDGRLGRARARHRAPRRRGPLRERRLRDAERRLAARARR